MVLLLKRRKGNYAGLWSIPGGHAKEQESPLEAAKRESLEECGHNEGEEFAHSVASFGKMHFHTYLFKIAEPFDVVLSDEHSDYAWIPIESVKNYKLHFKFEKSWNKFKKIIRKNFKFVISFSEWIELKNSTYINYWFDKEN